MSGFQSLKQYLAGFRLLWLVAIFLCLSACATDLKQRVDHSIVIKNTGKKLISDVYVDYGYPLRIEYSIIRPSADKFTGGENPIPEIMTVRWKTSDGNIQNASVILKKNLEYATRLRAVELWINEEILEVYQATPRGAQEEFTDRKRIYPR